MEPVVLALASNESYFPGLYCAIASALGYLDPKREVDVKVLDGGLSRSSMDTLARLVGRMRNRTRLEFVPVNESIFRDATLGPGRSHMAYCRILLPHLLAVPRLIYLDCDVLVFRDLSPLNDLELSEGKVIAAVPDSETSCLAEDSPLLAKAIHLPPGGAYFNSGVMLMNLNELRRGHFFQRAVEFLNSWRGKYRFHDQSAINFVLHDQIEPLPAEWNRPAWRFDAQENNDLNCILHYTTSAPWLLGTRTSSQTLFERFAAHAGLAADFQKSWRQQFLRNALAPFRAVAFLLIAFFYRVAGHREKSAGYKKAGKYWLYYMLNAPRRRRLQRARAEEIRAMKFGFPGFESLT
ncbi:MAG TPA: glycosyltransferase family 8 protein [Candidatus Udaeobacter sp.]|jgi:lipopolysaccharide biosynthesis glycosyltransferase